MAHRRFLFLMPLALLAGAGVAQAHQIHPDGAAMLPPPALASAEAPLPMGQWLAECRHRLMSTAGGDPAMAGETCAAWWNYYTRGGMPDPHYGYAIPVVSHMPAVDCPEQVVVTTRKVVTRRTIVTRHHARSKEVRINN
ncbi:hypothetical protein GTZ99_15520 [Novosphingobium sp. FSY-8]|uniref:Uncharacterized protein n=1 Tax=Novosphingobium ovatum TaxID=1908523 RepID=A0ABW9XHD2_9SPHN|nr:hypothetical protein [Novosphingobium ovatum]NBC37964.1 hypothetical protein [Novosphingobium ovatum]